MVKPPSTMQPEAVNLQKAGRASNQSFGEDSFRNYMARKISLQREQFGVLLPPPPQPEPEDCEPPRRVSFSADSAQAKHESKKKRHRKRPRSMIDVLRKLQRRHGPKRQRSDENCMEMASGGGVDDEGVNPAEMQKEVDEAPSESVEKSHPHELNVKNTGKPPVMHRPDLFFRGVVVLVNGYTDPDTESLQRMLHRHGGDLEKYETTRITHIIAEHLSTAKAKIYLQQKRPTPVCYPSWIVDSIRAQRLMPYGKYLIREVRGKNLTAATQAARFFAPKQSKTAVIQKVTPSSPAILGRSNEEKYSPRKPSRYADTVKPKAASPPRRPQVLVVSEETSNEENIDECEMDLPKEDRMREVEISEFDTDTEPIIDCDDGGGGGGDGEESVAAFNVAKVALIGNKCDVEHSAANVDIASNDETPNLTELLDLAADEKLVVDVSVTLSVKESYPASPTKNDDEDHIIGFPKRKKGKRDVMAEENTMSQPEDVGALTTEDILSGKHNRITDSSKSAAEHTSTSSTDCVPLQQAIYSCNPGDDVNTSFESTSLISDSPTRLTGPNKRTDNKYIDGRVRTVGTDPHFVSTFFAASRLSFIGSYKQRTRQTNAKHVSRRKDQQRFVFHVDMDCFFAAVVLRNYPEYQDKPVAISHFGKSAGEMAQSEVPTETSTSECATCNYHARKYGIKKGMFLGRARQLCPELVVLKYDFEGYDEVAEQVGNILYGHVEHHNGNLEQVSCDEAFMELFVQKSDDAEQQAATIAETIRSEIFQVTRCTATVGVSNNKLLAKLATDSVKPNGSCVIVDHRQLLQNLMLRDLHGIGYRLERKLEEARVISVRDVWDLADEAEGVLCRILGPTTGRKILNFCQGVDDRSVKPVDRKTIGAECNYGVRFDGPYGVDHMVRELAKEVEKRMSNVGVRGSKLTLKLKQRVAGAPPPPKFLGHGKCHNLSRSCEVPGTATRSAQVFFECGSRLYQEMKVETVDIRGMGLIVSKLVPDDEVPNSGQPNHPSETSIAKFLVKRDRNGHRSAGKSTGKEVTTRHCHSSPVDSKTFVPSSPMAIEDDESDQEEDDDEVVLVNSGDPAVNDLDIELPSLSQLHLSQVDALPDEMKHSILSKIESMSKDPVPPSPPPMPVTCAAKDHRFLQTDVRRVMKLAAVKHGADVLEGRDGKIVSLTQLECLPLDLQLQIANADSDPVGKGARKRTWDNVSKRQVRPTEVLPRKASVQQAGAIETIVLDSGDEDEVSLTRMESSRNFFLDNVKPLMVFMDENYSCDDEALEAVIQFFRTLVAEEARAADAVTLLRSIQRRGDDWSLEAFTAILEKVNQLFTDLFGCGLDPELIGR